MNGNNHIKNKMLKSMLLEAFPTEFRAATEEFGDEEAVIIEKREDGIWAKTLVILDDLGNFPLHEKESYTWKLGKNYSSASRRIVRAAKEIAALNSYFAGYYQSKRPELLTPKN